ncbi:MAG TPA: isoprenylcysteine carboxylmethyltransferase family protein [Gemmatimonadaceae bacterium]|nr:isoprenylcysteine carboxylmethyltransferase family protein [Gemmatimonadaceae bacterium]
MVLIRHLFAIAALPFVVTVVIPIWIVRRESLALTIAPTAPGLIGQIVGLLFLTIGIALFGASLRRFVVDGEGTLAPWDPPRQLVVRGPYRYVRNPMISGVVFLLFGETLLFRSASLAQWAVSFLAINLIYIPLFEEPQLKRRFGEPYIEYSRHVSRLLPRIRPWTPPAPGRNAP